MSDFKLYISLQVGEILGPDNTFFAGERLGHTPSDEEATHHYINNGGAVSFHERNCCLVCDGSKCLKKAD